MAKPRLEWQSGCKDYKGSESPPHFRVGRLRRRYGRRRERVAGSRNETDNLNFLTYDIINSYTSSKIKKRKKTWLQGKCLLLGKKDPKLMLNRVGTFLGLL